jgi:hypothetical protein
MLLPRPFSAALVGLSLAACQDPDAFTSATAVRDPVLARSAVDNLGASGGGYYDIAGLPVRFAFSAVQTSGGKAAGQFNIFADEGGGLTVDVAGAVICMTEDPVNHRAWIGALVTRNTSTDPDLQTDIHEVGDDVWFRVWDAGEGSGASPDRTSFTGFKGAAGIQTSPEYCAARIWPDNNARTWPVTAGTISVGP